jgi:hypothetical protein
MAMSFTLSLGQWGGFYFQRGYSWRLCLGWVSLTWFPEDIDDILDRSLPH